MNTQRSKFSFVSTVAATLAAVCLCHVSAVKAANCSAPITDGDALMAWCSDALAAHYKKREQSVRVMSQQANGTGEQWVVIGASQVNETSGVVTYECSVAVGQTGKHAALRLVDPEEVWDPNEPIIIKGDAAGCE